MKCKSCGKEISDESRFCKYCGISLIDNPENVENNTKEKINPSEAMSTVLRIIEEGNSYYKNNNFLQAELSFRKAIEIEKNIPMKMLRKSGSLWLMLGITLLPQLKLNEAEIAFETAKKLGCDKGACDQHLNTLNKLKKDIGKQGIEVDENDPKWQKYKSYYFLPPNEKAFIEEVAKYVETEILEGSSKDFLITGLITSKVFSNRELATEFVENITEGLKLKSKSAYCKHCGVELPVIAIYCKKCGKKRE